MQINKDIMKTAVELFIEQLENQGDSWENVSIGRIQISIKVEDYIELQRQAKEIEKQQIEDAYYNGGDDMCPNGMPGVRQSEQYYNETFKSE